MAILNLIFNISDICIFNFLNINAFIYIGIVIVL